jgi:hypothetical protein
VKKGSNKRDWISSGIPAPLSAIQMMALSFTCSEEMRIKGFGQSLF